MPFSLRSTLLLTGFFWLLALVGVFLSVWCDRDYAANIVAFTGPIALVGAISSYIEWKVWKSD